MEILAQWSVYITRCSDNSLYTGISKNVLERIIAHNKGRGATYTRTRRPVKLLYVESGFTHGEALSREAQIKTFPQKKKLALCQNKRGQATR